MHGGGSAPRKGAAPSYPSTTRRPTAGPTRRCGSPTSVAGAGGRRRNEAHGIFDVEAVFLFPWGVVAERLGWFAVVEMTIFIAILGAGLLYAWRKGVLRWA